MLITFTCLLCFSKKQMCSPTSSRFQAIFDRNRKDELPGLQLGWIDGICAPLYEVTLPASPLSGLRCRTSAFFHQQPLSFLCYCPPLTPVMKLSPAAIQLCRQPQISHRGRDAFFWSNFKATSCSFENERALSDCEVVECVHGELRC